MSKSVDVLAVFCGLVTHRQHSWEPLKVVPEWNRPRATGLIANRARSLAGSWTAPGTPRVLRSLRMAEAEGLVECVGTGKEHNHAFNKSAASERELYWKLTDAALARCGGAA
jgi:hypothetical protein